MSEAWSQVDTYFAQRLVPDDGAPRATLAANARAGLPAIDVSPVQGQLLHILARMCGARRILEIGTLGGYSTIWLASALPHDGLLTTLEADPRYAEVAHGNIVHAGLAELVDIRIGLALDTLPKLAGEAPFDFVFIDADKPNNPHYLDWALRLSRPGTVIVADNVVRGGAVIDAASDDPSVQGTRRMIDLIAHNPRLTATALQTVGCKGWDGFAIAIVNADVE